MQNSEEPPDHSRFSESMIVNSPLIQSGTTKGAHWHKHEARMSRYHQDRDGVALGSLCKHRRPSSAMLNPPERLHFQSLPLSLLTWQVTFRQRLCIECRQHHVQVLRQLVLGVAVRRCHRPRDRLIVRAVVDLDYLARIDAL